MKKNKVSLLSLGCPRNLVDSEAILGRLQNKGYEISDIKDAEVAIVNTCAFIKDAKAESIDAILDLLELKKEGRLKKVIVYGCLVQRYESALKKEFPEVDAFLGTISLNHTKDRFPITAEHFAYLKVCEGCINKCSFCIIPKIKGKFTSEKIDSLLERVGAFDKSKIKELNIIGQDTSSYGLDIYGTRKLPELLKNIFMHSKNIPWVRLLYLYPHYDLVDGILDLMQREPRLCKYIDLPVQHVNNRILKLMNRRTTKSDIIKTIELIRKKVPEAAIRTSLIVGFPSETDKEFKELFSFVKEAKFERLGAFIYSPEEGTPAYKMKGQVAESVKKSHLNEIMLLQQEISKDFNKQMLGKTVDVLIDEIEGESYLGRTQFDAPEVDGMVYVKSLRVLKPGEFVKVKINDTLEYDLVGEVQS